MLTHVNYPLYIYGACRVLSLSRPVFLASEWPVFFFLLGESSYTFSYSFVRFKVT